MADPDKQQQPGGRPPPPQGGPRGQPGRRAGRGGRRRSLGVGRCLRRGTCSRRGSGEVSDPSPGSLRVSGLRLALLPPCAIAVWQPGAATRLQATTAAGTQPRAPGGGESFVPTPRVFLPQGRKPRAPPGWAGPGAGLGGAGLGGSWRRSPAMSPSVPCADPPSSQVPCAGSCGRRVSGRAGSSGLGLPRRASQLPPGRGGVARPWSGKGCAGLCPAELSPGKLTSAYLPEIWGRLPKEVWLEFESLWVKGRVR